jgi:predicted secreted protein
LFCLGLNRQDDLGSTHELLNENSRIRRLLEDEDNQQKIRTHVSNLECEIKEYLKYGFTILGLIGVNRSPSCGIETTSKDNKEIKGNGVFMKSIKEMLVKNGINIPMVGTKTSNVEESVQAVRVIFEKEET